MAYSWAMFPAYTERFGSDLRQLGHTPILIYYRVNVSRKLIEVLHFWHGSRQRLPATDEFP